MFAPKMLDMFMKGPPYFPKTGAGYLPHLPHPKSTTDSRVLNRCCKYITHVIAAILPSRLQCLGLK